TVRNFTGGKIDAVESTLQAINRELNEELNIQMQQTELDYLCEVVTDNHDRTDIISVHCDAGEITQRIIPAAEISAIKW
ncbi:NUDIX domain-containing protein, partial [Francisella tularensis]|uniref:NUDIX domain-containing protein n=1 Tax=Francisella tularensis TaxID=263 RepID=UPI002381BFDE